MEGSRQCKIETESMYRQTARKRELRKERSELAKERAMRQGVTDSERAPLRPWLYKACLSKTGNVKVTILNYGY